MRLRSWLQMTAQSTAVCGSVERSTSTIVKRREQCRSSIWILRHRYLIHDRERIFAKHLDDSIRALGVEVLRSPVASPKANAICERVIGTARRECLDWLIPVSEAHLRAILRCWVTHYNRRGPHSALGPGVPDPPEKRETILTPEPRHRLATGALVLAKSILGGLHHEYSLAAAPASA